VFAVGRDLSDQQRIEAEIRELNAALEQRVADRTRQLEAANAELESFGYSVSHDLGAPLRHLSGYVEFLRKDYAAAMPEPAAKLVERIGERAHYMASLVRALLNLSRVGRGPIHASDLDLTRLAEEVVADLRHAEPLREVEVTVEPGLRAHADLVLMRTLLQNLIGNAWKYTARTPSPRIEVGAMAKDGERVYFVRDNGAGFDLRDATRLFGAFQRLHPASEFEGTGIGLATVKRIVLRHGGRVWADAAPGQGATFYFPLGMNGV
jgi:light-regulated signal transduction histidine kinase (bacteriophytochrome)